MFADPATDKQRQTVAKLAEREGLTRGEASAAIAILMGSARGDMTAKQRLTLLGLAERLPKDRIVKLINWLKSSTIAPAHGYGQERRKAVEPGKPPADTVEVDGVF